MSAIEVDVEREEAAIAVERKLRRRDVVAALRIAEKMLAAVGDPFHRPPELPRGEGRERIFAIGKELGAEAAADIGRHHAHLVGGDLEHVRHSTSRTLWLPWLPSVSVKRVSVVFGDDRRGYRDSWRPAAG